MGVIDAYRRVLRNGPLTRLLIGEFVSSIGDWLYLVALLVVIWDLTNDPLVLGHRRRGTHPAVHHPVDPGRHRRRSLRPSAGAADNRRRSAACSCSPSRPSSSPGLPVYPGRRPRRHRDLFLGVLLARNRRLPAESGEGRIGARTCKQRVVEPRQPRLLHRPGLRGDPAGHRRPWHLHSSSMR